MSPSSYGYTYLTSYGWSGTGTALRKGAIAKPLAIPPKKNLSGLGKDRDEAFPFWDHLFAAASKAITIKVSSDEDEDEAEDPSSTDLGPAPLRRTATGIISNRRPVEGTPASTSGTTTPSLQATSDTDPRGAGTARLSLLATAKREAAKRGLYAQFFRGPVLGPDDGPPEIISKSPSAPTPVPERVDDQKNIVGGTKKGKKRKAEDRVEAREERRERKRLKEERKAVRATKRAEKALAKETNHHKHRGEDTRQAEDSQTQRKARKRARKSQERSRGGDLEQERYVQKGSEQEPASTSNE